MKCDLKEIAWVSQYTHKLKPNITDYILDLKGKVIRKLQNKFVYFNNI